MKLSSVSVPYRAFQKVSSLILVAVFISTAGPGGTVVGLAAGAVLILAAIGYEIAYYRRFEYELTADTFDITSGVISRRQREIPYGRIQNVDISRNVLQRLLGISSVSLETAGGSSTEGSIQYVTADEATRLQTEIRSLKKRASEPARRESETDSAVDKGDKTDRARPADVDSIDDEEELYAISPTELGLVGALSFDPRLIGLIVFLGSGSLPVLFEYVPLIDAIALAGSALVLVALLLVVSWLLGVVSAVTNYYGFRLTRAGDELRYERGLFRRYSGSIPLEKVQTLSIEDNPLKRQFGYATLAIETAGYAPNEGGGQGTQAAIPIAKRERVMSLAREIEPFDEPELERPPRRARSRYVVRYVIATAVLVAISFGVTQFVAVPVPWYLPAGLTVLIPFAAHLKWAHRGYWLGEDHLITRNGFWNREAKLVPYYRIQTVIDSRTVFQRRWDIGSVTIDTAGTRSITGHAAASVDFATETVTQLREDLPGRLQTALGGRSTPGSTLRGVDQSGLSADRSGLGGNYNDQIRSDTGGFNFPPDRQQSPERLPERDSDENRRTIDDHTAGPGDALTDWGSSRNQPERQEPPQPETTQSDTPESANCLEHDDEPDEKNHDTPDTTDTRSDRTDSDSHTDHSNQEHTE